MKPAKCLALSALIVLGAPSRAGAQQVFEELLDDGSANDSGYQGLVQNGSFVAGGWQTTVLDSRIRFDLNALGEFPEGIACGTVEVEFSGFDPITNFQGPCGLSDAGGECYVNTIGVYEGDHGYNHTAAANLETQLQIQATCEQCFDDQPGDLGRDRHLKFKGVSTDWSVQSNVFNAYLPPTNDVQWQDHMTRHYIASFTFSCARVDYRLEFGGTPHTAGSTWTWTTAPVGARPNMRYVFVGKDHSGGDKWIQGVLYHRVKVTRNQPCDCDDLPVCGDGVREGLEACEGTDLGGQTCASLGYAGGSLVCTASCSFDVSGCTMAPDAGVDASVDGGDAGHEPDAGDAGSDATAGDAGPGADAGGGRDTVGSGCGCQARGASGTAGSSFLLVLVAAFCCLFRRQRALTSCARVSSSRAARNPPERDRTRRSPP